jgi:hypothetical protein
MRSRRERHTSEGSSTTCESGQSCQPFENNQSRTKSSGKLTESTSTLCHDHRSWIGGTLSRILLVDTPCFRTNMLLRCELEVQRRTLRTYSHPIYVGTVEVCEDTTNVEGVNLYSSVENICRMRGLLTCCSCPCRLPAIPTHVQSPAFVPLDHLHVTGRLFTILVTARLGSG